MLGFALHFVCNVRNPAEPGWNMKVITSLALAPIVKPVTLGLTPVVNPVLLTFIEKPLLSVAPLVTQCTKKSASEVQVTVSCRVPGAKA